MLCRRSSSSTTRALLLTLACTHTVSFCMDRAAAQATPPTTVSVPKTQIAKDMWIANAKYSVDTSGQYQLVALAAGLDHAYAADPQLTKEQGLSIIHNTITSLQTWQSNAGVNANPTEIYQKTLSLMADVTSSVSVKAAASIGKDLLALLPTTTPGDDWGTINAFQSSFFELNRARESTVFEDVYDDAKASSALQSALDEGLGPQLKV